MSIDIDPSQGPNLEQCNEEIDLLIGDIENLENNVNVIESQMDYMEDVFGNLQNKLDQIRQLEG